MAFETPFVPRELMYVIIGLMMARSWFMESNDILKDTIIDAISHIWHCIVAIYSFHLIVSSFKQRYHSILEKTFDIKEIWQRKVIQGRQWGILNFYRSHSKGHTVWPILYHCPKDCSKLELPIRVSGKGTYGEYNYAKRVQCFLLRSSLTCSNPNILYFTSQINFCRGNIAFLVLKVWNDLVRRLFMQIKYCPAEWFFDFMKMFWHILSFRK